LAQPQPPPAPAEPTPDLADLLDHRLVAAHPGVPYLATREPLAQHRPDLARGLVVPPLGDRFLLAFQLEAEVLQPPAPDERGLASPRLEHDLLRPAHRVAPHEVHRELRALDGRARDAEAIGEVAQRPGDRAPAPAHARLRDARVLPVSRLFVD